ncbi:MAG: CPBP family intramembrane metalloprotease [Proteobacteria bacterium]|nr:CPBP family intramembrane metalloprotease [Pseudomonadota bacterium]
MLRIQHRDWFLLTVGNVAALSIMIDAKHGVSRGIVLEPAWTIAVYLALPLVAIVALDMKRQVVGSSLVALGGLAIAVPIAARSWFGMRLVIDKNPEMYLIAPTVVAVVLLVLAAYLSGVKLAEWGFSAGDWRWWVPRFLGLMAGIVPLVLFAAWMDPEFLDFYPEYVPARTSAWELFKYQLGNGFYMVGWEFFFRGFLIFALARHLGWTGAAIFQAIPFMLLHEGKPELEMAASFGGAVLLAYFCLRARSFWPAVALHWGLNLSMEVLGFCW